MLNSPSPLTFGFVIHGFLILAQGLHQQYFVYHGIKEQDEGLLQIATTFVIRDCKLQQFDSLFKSNFDVEFR